MSTRSSRSPDRAGGGAGAADGPVAAGSAQAAREHPDSAAGFRRHTGRKVLFILVSLLVLLALTVLGVYAGAADLGLAEIGRALVSGALPFLGVEAESTTVSILWELRLPRVVMAVLAGAGLGLAGATMQGVLRNPLTSPFTLGVSAASGFGAALAIVFGVGLSIGGRLLIVSNAFLFANLSVLFVFVLSRLRGVSSVTVILSGIAVMYLFSALTSLLQFVATSEQLSGIVFWLLGSLAVSTWEKSLVVLGVLAVTTPVILRFSWDLNALAAGEQSARTMGTNVRLVVNLSMVLSALIASAVVCFNGVIGFVGLVGPHIARLLIGGDHRFLLPASGILGAVILLACDIAARTLFSPSEIPLGIVTSLVGVPFFVFILLTRRKEQAA